MRFKLPHGVHRADLIAALATLGGLIVACVIHGFFTWPFSVQVGGDEGYEAAVVERVIDGRWLPYVDGLSHRGPFLYWTQAIFHLIFGRFEWTGTRMLGMVACLVTTGATFLAGWAARWPLAGALGALTYVFITCAVLPPGGTIGVHGEPVGTAYLMLAVFLTALGLYRAQSSRGRIALLASGGALVAVSGLTKQTLAPVCFPLMAWILLSTTDDVPGRLSQRRGPWWPVLAQGLVPFVGGGVTVVVLVLGRYLIAGELGTFLFWSTGFNAKVYMAPYQGQIFALLSRWFFDSRWVMAGVGGALLMLMRPLALMERVSWSGFLAAARTSRFELSVASMALVQLATSAFPLRFWDHYFVPVYPLFGLLFGILIESLLRRDMRVPALALASACSIASTLLLLAGADRLRWLEDERAKGRWSSPRPEPACSEIDRLAGDGSPLFVWGTAGDLYITCQRRSVSRFTYTTVLMGIVPPFWTPDPTRVAPGSREMLLDELSTARPPVIIDVPISKGAAMMDVPALAEFVKAEYCVASRLKDKLNRWLTFYARRDLDACQKAHAAAEHQTP